jgi:hypothetical protein
MRIHVVRENVRYVPHRYEDGTYKVLRRSGKGSNRKENAISCGTLEEVADYIKKGFAVRMSPEKSAPIRVPPDGITIEP